MFDRVCPYLAGPAPFVTFNHYPVQGRQWEIYLHWFRTYTAETEWAAFLDLDEFLVLPGVDNIGRYVEQFPPACDAIHVHWIFYGAMGFATRPPGSVLRQYTRREARVSLETKTIVRPDRIQPDLLDKRFQQAFWHLWDDSHKLPLNLYNSLGQQVFPQFQRARFASENADAIRASAFIAHFAIKSLADFQRRVDRGKGGEFRTQQSWSDMLSDGRAETYLRETDLEQDWYLKFYWERLVGIPEATSIEPGAI